jgi:hypothetical protein
MYYRIESRLLHTLNQLYSKADTTVDSELQYHFRSIIDVTLYGKEYV